MGRHHDSRLTLGVIVLLCLFVPLGAASAQVPDEFTNLQILPKDIGKRDLMEIMRAFSSALGVRCKFCHVGESENSLEGYDFASDDPKHKKVARVMMETTHEINTKLLPRMGKDSFLKVRCVTCHRGVKEPEALDDILLGVAGESGVDAAAKRYREMREQYYGTGAYDFSVGTLSAVAENLAMEQQDVEGAIELAQLNVEVHPDASPGYALLGQLYAMKGDKQQAVASLERAIELDPQNDWAKQILSRVRPSE
jgi:tetratricopeptide (TPR) repeat protein